MHARSALFELYGDQLPTRGGAAPVSAPVRLLEPLEVADPAVRTARRLVESCLSPRTHRAHPQARAAVPRRADEGVSAV